MSKATELVAKLTFWFISLLSVLKLINVQKWFFIGKYFDNAFWIYFVDYTHYVWIGWAVLAIICFRGLPNIKWLNKLRPKK